jgi:hypothetical protein
VVIFSGNFNQVVLQRIFKIGGECHKTFYSCNLHFCIHFYASLRLFVRVGSFLLKDNRVKKFVIIERTSLYYIYALKSFMKPLAGLSRRKIFHGDNFIFAFEKRLRKRDVIRSEEEMKKGFNSSFQLESRGGPVQ